jgi:predicted lysophospholipase L1 biosynthesis ABC-type transport system permease subunit
MILVTCNAKDFALTHEAWTLWPVTWGVASVTLFHEGILVIPNGSRAQAPRMATLVAQFLTSGESPRNRYFWLKMGGGWREGTR